MRTRVAWALAVLTLACAFTDVVIMGQFRPLLSSDSVTDHGFPFLTGAVVLSGLLGATIITRFDRHPVGWLVCLIGATGGLSQMLESYSIWVRSAGGPGSSDVAGIAGTVSAAIDGQLAVGMVALIFLLAPDGRLLSPRWRVVVGMVVLGELMYALAVVTGDPTTFDPQVGPAGATRETLLNFGFLLIAAALGVGVVSVVLRLRRSSGIPRQQVRLIAVAATLVLAGLLNLIVVTIVSGDRHPWLASVPLFISFLLLPVLHTIAVLRYRLHDVEVIVNRALVLAAGTAFAAVGYTALVVLVGSSVTRRAEGSVWLSLVGAALVALAFQPLRRSAIRLANRLAFGARARPYVALSDFSRRLAETPAVDTLLPAVAEAAARAVSARGASATLVVPGSGEITARSGQDPSASTKEYEVLVRSSNTTLGNITVHLPKGRPVTASDGQLLQALADQASVAFRNTALEAQLAERVSDLDQTTQALAESRNRLVDADNSARSALEAAISRRVLPLLTPMPTRIEEAKSAVIARSPRNGLPDLVSNTNTALEALREITHGVFPTQLARSGLAPALRSCLGASGLASSLHLGASAEGRRFAPRTESALYFCCAEAVPAMSEVSRVDVNVHEGTLVFRITGVAVEDMDLEAVGDRVAAADGSLETDGDQLAVRVPERSGTPVAPPSLSSHAATAPSRA